MIDSSRALWRLGRAQRLAGREQWERAWDEFEKAIDADPTDARIRAQYGIARSRAGQTDRAADLLEDAIELAPRRAAHRFSLAIVLCDGGRWEEADGAAVEGLERSPRNALGHSLRALVQMGRGDVPAGCRALLEREPTDNLAVRARLLARIEAHLMDQGPVTTWFLFPPPAEDDPPEQPDAGLPAGRLVQRGEVLMEQGRYASAAACFQNAREKDPSRTDATVSLGAACLARGRWDEALEGFRTVGADEPFAAFAMLYSGAALLYQGKLDEAEAVLESVAARRDVQDVREIIGYFSGLAAAARGDLGGAARHLTALLDAEWGLLRARARRVLDVADTAPASGARHPDNG